jgi:uncharacterized protein YodC (DUF2158 family)
MPRKYQDGDRVVHTTDRVQCMAVIGYTGDGKVICRWKGKTGFQREEFVESELEKWVDTPAISFGQIEGHNSDKYRW